MKKSMTIVLISLVTAFLVAQSPDPVVLSYQRNFIRASISTKIELLNDASRITTVNMTPLYTDSISFVLTNYPVLGIDAQLLEIASVSAQKAAQYKDPSINESLKRLFTGVNETRVRVACIQALSSLAKGKQTDIAFLEKWFSDSIDASVSGKGGDVKVLAICADALGKLSSPSSFPVLFRAATSSLDSSIVQASSVSLNSISEGYTDNILAIIRDKGIKEMYAAFSFSAKKENLANTDKGKIAEAAFTRAITIQSSGTDSGLQASLITESMASLSNLKWSGASAAVVRYFYRVQSEYKSDVSGIDQLIPVINCMGSMATTEAAQALSIYLGLLNSEAEQKKAYNEQILLAVIRALGELGDKTAFDYLLYVGYLDYPESVKQASRDALARLQW